MSSYVQPPGHLQKWMAIVCAVVCAAALAYGLPQFKRALAINTGSSETMATVVDYVTRENERVLNTQVAHFLVTEHADATGARHISRHQVNQRFAQTTPEGARIWLRYADTDPAVAEIVLGDTRKRAIKIAMFAFVLFGVTIVGLIGWLRETRVVGRPRGHSVS